MVLFSLGKITILHWYFFLYTVCRCCYVQVGVGKCMQVQLCGAKCRKVKVVTNGLYPRTAAALGGNCQDLQPTGQGGGQCNVPTNTLHCIALESNVSLVIFFNHICWIVKECKPLASWLIGKQTNKNHLLLGLLGKSSTKKAYFFLALFKRCVC